jgi:holo-[acyl-carrier protein] synthase
MIARVREIAARWGDRFAHRVLGPMEIAEFTRRAHRGVAGQDRALRYLAKRFAAKEAIGKALGVGLTSPMSLHAVEILNNERGAPTAHPRGRLCEFLADKGYRIHISLSDEIEHAQALAIVES